MGLGFKSLQNQFFYVDADTIETYKIEPDFLQPIVRMRDLANASYFQKPEQSVSVFYCKKRIQDLGGTGALKYINTMEKRPATEKKQNSKNKIPTIREVLEEQGPGFWYAPKAQLHLEHIWLRKAFDAKFNPYLFSKPTALDQRCNYVRPIKDISWKTLAALLTSSLFALSLESHGAASMGAGALEVATSRLPELKVIDIRTFSEPQRASLLSLAEEVWNNEAPCDWEKGLPSAKLKMLDEWLLKQVKGVVSLSSVYADISNTCRARLGVAKERKTTKKTKSVSDVTKVAEGIVKRVEPLLKAHRFPESFCNGSEHLAFKFNHERLHVIVTPLLSETVIVVQDSGTGAVLMEQQFDRDVAQVIAKSLLLGRREFSSPANSGVAQCALKEFDQWFANIRDMVDEGCRSSSVGTSYEEQVHKAVFNQLGIHPKVEEPELFGEFSI